MTADMLRAMGFPLDPNTPFTTTMATAAGVSRQRLHQLAAQGQLRRPLKSVYIAADVEDSLDLRCAMLRLVVPPDAFVCDRSAAWLHGATNALAPNEDLDVPPISCFRPATSTRLRNEMTISGQRSLREDEVMEIRGLVVTTPLRTALDLGRLQRTNDLRLAGMDAMLAIGAFDRDELLGEVPRFKGQRGIVALRTLAPLADPGSQSFGESALRLRWYAAGLPRPETQVPVERPGQFPYFLDLGLPERRFGAEYDGEADHSEDEDREHDETRRAWLRGTGSWRLEVFRKEHVFGRRQNADQILRKAWEQHRRIRRRIIV